MEKHITPPFLSNAQNAARAIIANSIQAVLYEAASTSLQKIVLQKHLECDDNSDESSNKAISVCVTTKDVEYCYDFVHKVGTAWMKELEEGGQVDVADIVRLILSRGRFLERRLIQEEEWNVFWTRKDNEREGEFEKRGKKIGLDVDGVANEKSGKRAGKERTEEISANDNSKKQRLLQTADVSSKQSTFRSDTGHSTISSRTLNPQFTSFSVKKMGWNQSILSKGRPPPHMTPHPSLFLPYSPSSCSPRERGEKWLKEQISQIDEIGGLGGTCWYYDWDIIQRMAGKICDRMHLKTLRGHSKNKGEDCDEVGTRKMRWVDVTNKKISLGQGEGECKGMPVSIYQRKRKRRFKPNPDNSVRPRPDPKRRIIDSRPPCASSSSSIKIPWSQVIADLGPQVCEELERTMLHHSIVASQEEETVTCEKNGKEAKEMEDEDHDELNIHTTVQGALKIIGWTHLYESQTQTIKNTSSKRIKEEEEEDGDDNDIIKYQKYKRMYHVARRERLGSLKPLDGWGKSGRAVVSALSKRGVDEDRNRDGVSLSSKVVRAVGSSPGKGAHQEDDDQKKQIAASSESMEMDLGECMLEIKESSESHFYAFRSLEITLDEASS